MTRRRPLWRACIAELLGTGMLTLAVVGSGIAATSLSADAGYPRNSSERRSAPH